VTERQDPLIEAIQRAGDVPPPPAREDARARAMASVAEHPLRRRLTKAGVTLLAAALLAVPAGVIAVRARTPDSPAIQGEQPEPRGASGSPSVKSSREEMATIARGDDDRRGTNEDERVEDERENEGDEADGRAEVEEEGDEGEHEEVDDASSNEGSGSGGETESDGSGSDDSSDSGGDGGSDGGED
jgi:hypothetical protein